MKSTNSIRRQSICHLLARLSGLLVITSLICASLALVDGWSMRVLAVPFLGIVHLVLLSILEGYDNACWKTKQWASKQPAPLAPEHPYLGVEDTFVPARFSPEGTFTCFLVWFLSGRKKQVDGVSEKFVGRCWRIVTSGFVLAAAILYGVGINDAAVVMGLIGFFSLVHGNNTIQMIELEISNKKYMTGYYSSRVVAPTTLRRTFLDFNEARDQSIIMAGRFVVIATAVCAAVGFFNIDQPLEEWAMTFAWAPVLYMVSIMVGVSWHLIVLEGLSDLRSEGDRAQKIRGALSVIAGNFIIAVGVGSIVVWMQYLIN